jgi:hypothetical protein
VVGKIVDRRWKGQVGTHGFRTVGTVEDRISCPKGPFFGGHDVIHGAIAANQSVVADLVLIAGVVGAKQVQGTLGRTHGFVEHGNELVTNQLTIGVGQKAIAVVAGIGQGGNLARRGRLSHWPSGYSKVGGASF